MTEIDDNVSKLRLELRRGVVVLAVLSRMTVPQYGYSLIQELAERGLDIEEGTLYPLLRRLEKQGLLESEWEVGEARPLVVLADRVLDVAQQIGLPLQVIDLLGAVTQPEPNTVAVAPIR